MELNEVLEKVKNNQLSTMSQEDLRDAYRVLRTHPEHSDELMQVADAISGYGLAQDKSKEQEQAQAQEAQAAADEQNKEAETVSEEQVKKNTIEINKYSEQFQLDKESNAALDNLRVVDDEGKTVDVKSDVVELAKLGAAVDLSQSKKPLSAEDYKIAVHNEVAKILSTIIITKDTRDTEHQQQSNANKAGQEFQNLYNGKPVKVDSQSFLAGMSVKIEDTKAKNDGLMARFKNSSFFKGVKEKLGALDTKLHDRFGKKYDDTKEVVERLVKQGTMTEVLVGGLVAGAAVATAGTAAAAAASVAASAYSAWIGYRRISPVFAKYKQEKKAHASDNQPYGFGDFMKTHKKEVYKAALYAGIATAGVIAGGASALMSSTQSTATGLQAVAETAGTARIVGMGTVAIAPQAADIFTAKDGAERKQAIKRTVLAAGLFAATSAAGSLLHNDAQAAEVSGVEGQEGVIDPNQSIGDISPESDVTDTASDNVDNVNTDANDAAVEPITVGSREQAIYERNLKLVPKSDFMVDNVNDGLVNLPEGMTPEMAVNLARVEYLYYGDKTGLQALLDCDGITINTEEYFRGLTDKFVTQVGDPRGLVGYPTDPNYVADLHIHARIDDVDCSGVKITRTITGKPPVAEEEVVVPVVEETVEPVKPVVIKEEIQEIPTPDPILEEETPVVETTPEPEKNNNLPWGHYNNASEFNDAVNKSGVVINEGTEVQATSAAGGSHYQNAADMLNRNPGLAGDAPLEGSDPVTEVVKPSGKVKGNSIESVILQLMNQSNGK